MCTRPITKDNRTFACRTCDQCISTRRHGWVARAMAEKTDHQFCLVLALTYSDETQEGRDGARMFQYRDISGFVKRLRSAAAYDFKKTGRNEKPILRFLCAGEQGDRNGRCHWHMVIYSNFDLTKIGTIRGRYGILSDRADMLTVGKQKRRLNWEKIWPFGFVTFQEPDQGGMNYVLSYCLKDQFTAEKSRDTMRQAKSENFATGLFRMSKRPAIGEAYLYRKLSELSEKNSVLPSLNIKVPDFHGHWQPSGAFREKLLWGLVAANVRAQWATGANAPQWRALLASCKDNETDLKVLNYGEEKEEELSFERELEIRKAQTAGEHARRELVRQCGKSVACDWCLGFLSEADLLERGLARHENAEGVWEYTSTTGETLAQRRNQFGRGINPDCQDRSTKLARLTFPASAG